MTRRPRADMWLSPRAVGRLEGISGRTVQRRIEQGFYPRYRIIPRKGEAIEYQIPVVSISDTAKLALANEITESIAPSNRARREFAERLDRDLARLVIEGESRLDAALLARYSR